MLIFTGTEPALSACFCYCQRKSTTYPNIKTFPCKQLRIRFVFLYLAEGQYSLVLSTVLKENLCLNKASWQHKPQIMKQKTNWNAEFHTISVQSQLFSCQDVLNTTRMYNVLISPKSEESLIHKHFVRTSLWALKRSQQINPVVTVT